jgi:hypothetical protein
MDMETEEKLKEYLINEFKKGTRIRIGLETITNDLQLEIKDASFILRKWESKGVISIKGYYGANIENFASPWLITINDIEFFE